MPGIALAHLRRQGDQRGAVVERPALRQVLCLQGEEITLQQGDAGDPVAAETIQLIDLGAQVVLLEEVAHGLFRKLHPQHVQSLGGQPGQVQGLAAQRHQDLFARLQSQPRQVAHQVGIDLVQVEADLVVRPAGVPKIRLHPVLRIRGKNRKVATIGRQVNSPAHLPRALPPAPDTAPRGSPGRRPKDRAGAPAVPGADGR